MLVFIIGILCLSSQVIAQSTVDIFSVSPIYDPFYDTYTDKIVHLNRSALMAIPRMDDKAFLHSLYGSPRAAAYGLEQTISQDKSDDQLLEQAEIDREWEALVVSGPLSISYLGSLLVLASQRDFSFARPTPDFIYRYIRYPNSFRATLTQLSGDMYETFLDAHTSMGQIQLLMQQIPSNIRTTLKVLTQASPHLIQSILPSSLTNIERITNDCVRLANGTAHRFGSVMHLLQEIIEMNENTQSWNRNVTEFIATAINESLLEQAEIDRRKDEIKTQYTASKQALKDAHQAYLDAVHNIPTRAPVSVITIAPTRPPVYIPNRPSEGFFCGTFGAFCSDYRNALNAYNDAVQQERHRQEDNRAIKEAFDATREVERQRIAREETIIAEKRKDAETSLDNFRRAENAYEEYYKQLLEKENALAHNIIEISKLKLDQIDPEQIIKILLNATIELKTIKAQWDGLTRFFLGLAGRVSITQGVIIHEFIDVIRSTILLDAGAIDNATLQFFTELLIEPVDMVDRHAHILYVMAKTYYDISGEFMMRQIAGISAAQTAAEREDLLQQISLSALETSVKVSRLAQERRDEYRQKVATRKAELAVAAGVRRVR